VPPFFRELMVTSYKVEQRRLTYHGRDFHFVSYDGNPEDERRGMPAMPAMWYLMGPGRRWPAVPQVPGQADEALEHALVGWLKNQGLGPTAAT
jgi:hypothetical protein